MCPSSAPSKEILTSGTPCSPKQKRPCFQQKTFLVQAHLLPKGLWSLIFVDALEGPKRTLPKSPLPQSKLHKGSQPVLPRQIRALTKGQGQKRVLLRRSLLNLTVPNQTCLLSLHIQSLHVQSLHVQSLHLQSLHLQSLHLHLHQSW
jgi:hypothetical protein